MLAGIGLALGEWFAHVFRASCIDLDHLVPWGSHPDLDTLWATERTTSHLDGVEVTRTDKVREIACSELALTRLKVCWRDDIDTNCGRCEKCIRTQIALAIVGALERAPVFVEPLTVEAVMNLPASDPATPRPGQEVLWSEMCESIPDGPRLAALRSAACRRLPARHPLASMTEERGPRLIAVEAPVGAAINLLPVAATGLLPAPVTFPDCGADTAATTSRIEITWTTPARVACHSLYVLRCRCRSIYSTHAVPHTIGQIPGA